MLNVELKALKFDNGDFLASLKYVDNIKGNLMDGSR